MANARKFLFALIALLSASAANADWHGGKVVRVLIAYDGSSVVFVVAGHARNNCTCYSPWPDAMCLNRTRSSFKEEVALLYMARARGSTLSYNIDENSCQVQAMYESD
jgi:hypothetical protein